MPYRSLSALVAINLIKSYQKHLSPIKGYECAYRVLNGGPSCSAIGLEAFSTNNFATAIEILNVRFKDCRQAANELNLLHPAKALGVECCGAGCGCY